MTKTAGDILKEKMRGRVLFNEPMSEHTSFRIGGPAEIWVDPESEKDLQNCFKLAADVGLPIFVVGKGTNLLVSDRGIEGLVINAASRRMKKMSSDGTEVSASSSVSLKEFLDFCCGKGLRGMEFLAGIPGSVGGAVMTNAASRHYGNPEEWHSIGDFVKEVKILGRDGAIRNLKKDEISFAYKSIGLEDRIILDVIFDLNKSGSREVKRERKRYLAKKSRTQDLGAPSAGCIFKNPAGTEKSAGRLIDECGLKGACLGGAAISERHANFIVNRGGAKASDVTALIDLVKVRVKEGCGIDLDTEIKIV